MAQRGDDRQEPIYTSQAWRKALPVIRSPDAGVLRVVLKAMEPIPAIDTFVESDWRMKWDTVDGVKTIRVLAGYESPDGTLDPEQARVTGLMKAGSW